MRKRSLLEVNEHFEHKRNTKITLLDDFRLAEDDVIVLNHLAQVDQSITHTTEGSVDADIGLLGYLLEAESRVVTKHNDLALLLGQMINKTAYVEGYLLRDETILNR